MKKRLFLLGGILLMGIGAVQAQGNFEVYDCDGFRLHVYHTCDVMDDASYIIEGRDGVVTMEHPLFRDNVAQFDAYVARLGKPIEARIADFHIGGTAECPVVMPQGMPAFVQGEVYAGMMKQFAQLFGDAMVELPTGEATEVAFGDTKTWAGVAFRFERGAVTDFPAAGIVIGGQVYYTHWAPAKTHVSRLQVASLAAVDAEIALAEQMLASGCELFIGGHGGVVDEEALRFRIDYLNTMKRLASECDTPEVFAEALMNAYPDLAGQEGIPDLAQALYGNR